MAHQQQLLEESPDAGLLLGDMIAIEWADLEAQQKKTLLVY